MIGESREEGQEYQTLEHDTSEDSGEAHRLRSELGVENDEESRGQRPMRVVNIEVEREQGRRQDLESHCSSGVIGIRIGLTPHAGAATPLQACTTVACLSSCNYSFCPPSYLYLLSVATPGTALGPW